MHSINSTTQTSLELTIQNRRINRYILSVLRTTEKKVEEYYIKKYNPFYKWQIGILSEDEIIKALTLFFGKNETGEKVKKNIAASKAFSQLVASYKEKAGTKEPKSLTQRDWLDIREHYEKKLKEEYENTFGTISHNENIDYGEHKYSKSNEETTEIDSAKDDYGLEDDENDETQIMRVVENEICEVLDLLHKGNWVAKAVPSDKKGFSYQMAILNLNIEAETFNNAISFLKSKYSNAMFTLKDIKGQSYIEGFMNTG